jgi:hypothetical protein
MAHYRKHLAAAVALSGIFVVEAAAGYEAGGLSLITPNFSLTRTADEVQD